MPTPSVTLERINWAISRIKTGEFTIGELFDILQEKHPKYVPSTRTLKYYLRWPQVNAVEDNGMYRKNDG